MIFLFFQAFGEIKAIEIKIDPATSSPRGFAFITFEKKDSVILVMENHPGNEICGKWVEVTKNKSKYQRKAKIKLKTNQEFKNMKIFH